MSRDIEFLGLEDVLEIHRDQIERYGGSCEVRDVGLLQSAIAAPQSSFDGRHLHEDLCAMAAAYLFHIVQNHPFTDGNKRTGAVAAVVFLALNGVDLEAPEEGFEQLVTNVATGQDGKNAVADFFRRYSVTEDRTA